MRFERFDVVIIFDDPYYIIGGCRVPGVNGTREALLGVKDVELFNKYLAQNAGEAPTIPNSVEIVADFALQGFGALETVTMPKNLLSIGEGAFRNCGLKNIDFSNSRWLTTIEKEAFYNCKLCGSIDLSSCANLTMIGKYAFGLNRCDVVYLPKQRYHQVACEGAFSKAIGGNTAVKYGREDAFEQVRLC